MKIIGSILRAIDKIYKPKKVSAHCDVPCGVYEGDSAKWAAETCYQLTKKLLDQKVPAADDVKGQLEYRNFVTRAIHTKDEYAQICKEQVLILWTDYFKPEHLAKHPNLHDLVWKTTKQCSAVKRSVSLDECEKLRKMVDEVAHIFSEIKTASK